MYDLAVTEQQIRDWNLSTREPKRKSGADQRWSHDFACELEAIPPDTLRELIRNAIEEHLPKRQCDILKKAEESERELLRAWVGRLNPEYEYEENNEDEDEDDE